MKAIGGILAAVIIGAVVMMFAGHMNSVPTLDESAKASWAQVQNQYQRRADLVPNLVATVKGYASHEKEVLLGVSEARAKVGQMNITPAVLNDPKAFAAFEKAQGELTSALSRLMMVSERYPELKADKNFMALQVQLEGTENRISVARRDYIQSVQAYNLELRTVPGRWVAAILYPDATIKETFSAEPQSQKAPTVAF
ncbi:LemA family protein [Sulfuricurvum sp.]|uniref:LemA family protein n=1 Tax=Sulfuricurvum sp. TaxID=2025608 RepID=UPI002E322BEE|nr:LemA family protein [Sulfuricurvum sp.]HEX5329957.1 LemA family protein [Sulfuricurvum sp.]